MNKKAVAKIIVDIWAYVLFALLICFFLLIIMFAKKTSDLQLDDFTEQADADYALMTYLRSPVPDMNMDFAQYIILTAAREYPKIYELNWTNKTQELLNPVYSASNNWIVSFSFKKDNEIYVWNAGEGSSSIDTSSATQANITLPSDQDIKIIFYLKKK